jgi:MFS family permease
MFRKIFTGLLAPRHPWRKVTFSELSEMYLAVFLRTIALSMVGIFIPLYLLKSGYRLPDVLLFYTLFYGFGILNDVGVAHLIARFGPKHVMRISFLLQVVFSLLLINLHNLPYAVFILSLVASISSTMYFLPYHIDFSKIKHPKHGGKELGFLQVMERVASIIGPLGGGLLATFVSPQAAFWAAAVAMFIATIILMLTPEPVQTHQKLRFKGLKIKNEWRDYFSFTALCVENTTSILLWPIYLAAVVFTGDAYVKIGGIASLSVFVAVVVAVPLGRLLDNQKGRLMIKYGTVANSFVHLGRLFVNGIPGAMAIASVNEPLTLVYKMAYVKGYYDSADDHPGYRIAYITIHEVIGDIMRTLFWFSLMVISLFASPYITCTVGFIVAAIASLLIRTERFKALR